MWLGKPREMNPKGTLAKNVLIVATRGTSLGTGVARLEDESVPNVTSMSIDLLLQRREKPETWKTKHHPTIERKAGASR